MKKTLPVLIILFAFIHAHAQNTNLHAGGVVSFLGKKENCLGTEIIATIPYKQLSFGGGVQILKFNKLPNIYAPVFASFNLNMPSHKIIYFFHVDPGYGIYNYDRNYTINRFRDTLAVKYKDTGGFYLGTGAGVRFKSKLSPYINIQYTVYGFRNKTSSTVLNQPERDVFINDEDDGRGITISAGIWLDAETH